MNRIEIPSVSMFMGKVKNNKTGFIKAFIQEITIAAKIAAGKLDILMPGINHVTKSNKKDSANILRINDHIFSPFIVFFILFVKAAIAQSGKFTKILHIVL